MIGDEVSEGPLPMDVVDEDENFELIEGEVVPTSPRGSQHEVIKAALLTLLAQHPA